MRLLIPFPGLGSFLGVMSGVPVEVRPRDWLYRRDHRITIWSELVAARCSTLAGTVRFEPSNRCPPSLKPPAFKLCARTPPRVNISIKQRPGIVTPHRSYTMSDSAASRSRRRSWNRIIVGRIADLSAHYGKLILNILMAVMSV